MVERIQRGEVVAVGRLDRWPKAVLQYTVRLPRSLSQAELALLVPAALHNPRASVMIFTGTFTVDSNHDFLTQLLQEERHQGSDVDHYHIWWRALLLEPHRNQRELRKTAGKIPGRREFHLTRHELSGRIESKHLAPRILAVLHAMDVTSFFSRLMSNTAIPTTYMFITSFAPGTPAFFIL